jgi:hypothetical protein
MIARWICSLDTSVKRPKVFIGSSNRNIRLAEAVQRNFARTQEIEAIVWDQSTYRLSVSNLTNLLNRLEQSDFGVFVLAEDDEAIIKGKPVRITRDNVIFECGMYVGRLGPGRVFAIAPPRTETTHILTDLDGVMLASLQEVSDNNVDAMVGPACGLIRDQIQELGRKREEPEVSSTQPPSRDGQYLELLRRDQPELHIERFVRTDELLQNGDMIVREQFVGVRAYGDRPICEVEGSVQSQSGRPSTPEVISETEGYSVSSAWENINSSGPFYPVKTIFNPALTKSDLLSFRRQRLLQNGIFWTQQDRLEATGRRSNKENISQRVRQAFGYIDIRIIFPPKRFPTKFNVTPRIYRAT